MDFIVWLMFPHFDHDVLFRKIQSSWLCEICKILTNLRKFKNLDVGYDVERYRLIVNYEIWWIVELELIRVLFFELFNYLSSDICAMVYVSFLEKMESDLGKLFIGGISWDTDEERLKDYFRIYGEVVEAVIMRDRATGRARGFGFVVFADPVVAERVITYKHVIDGRTVSGFFTNAYVLHHGLKWHSVKFIIWH